MMVAISTWFALGAVGMGLGTLVLAYGFRFVPERNRGRYGIVVAVPLIAFVAYAIMALDLGAIETQSGTDVFVVRYIDWLLTTPLHILYLGLLAGASKRVLGWGLGLMSATIVFGLGGAYFLAPLKWILFVAGSVAFVGVVYIAFYGFDDAAQGTETLPVFRKLRAFVVVLWLVYPVIWILAPIGLGLMDLVTTALVVSYIDVVAKVGFGLIALSTHLTATETSDQSATTAD